MTSVMSRESYSILDVLGDYQDYVDGYGGHIFGVDSFGRNVLCLITDSGIYSLVDAGMVEKVRPILFLLHRIEWQ